MSGTHGCKPLFPGLGDTNTGFKASEVGRFTGQGSPWYPALPKPVWELHLRLLQGTGLKGEGEDERAGGWRAEGGRFVLVQ